MRLNAVKILKISITSDSKNKILEEIQKYLFENKKNTLKSVKIFTPNTEQLVFANKNRQFGDILNQADISLPDSSGVVWASNILLKKPIGKQIPGIDFMQELVGIAQKQHVTIGLIGARDGLAVEALKCLQKTHKNLNGWAIEGPEIEETNLPSQSYFSKLGKQIISNNTKIIFVALGPPKQEYFIERLTKEIPNGVLFMAVGGSFDIISGRLPRAPKWFRTIGFEWLWRLVLEPWRIKRQLSLLAFVFLVIKEKLYSLVD